MINDIRESTASLAQNSNTSESSSFFNLSYLSLFVFFLLLKKKRFAI